MRTLLPLHLVAVLQDRNHWLERCKRPVRFGAYSSVAMIARKVSIPSPFSELVTTISG